MKRKQRQEILSCVKKDEHSCVVVHVLAPLTQALVNKDLIFHSCVNKSQAANPMFFIGISTDSIKEDH